MNIALIGYGKMGKTIEALGLQQGHNFPLIIDAHNQDLLNAKEVEKIDAAIEFTIPTSAPENIRSCIDLGLPVVSGTTGWNEQIPEIEDYCREKGSALFHASNFSIGVNILFAMNRKLASIMAKFPQYKISMTEVHHIRKLDAPSGTAITLAEQVIEMNRKISGWYLKNDAEKEEQVGDIIPIEAIREGEVKGQHSINYESDLDSITLMHNASTRDAFASGVFLAATFIQNRKGVFGMQDLLNL